MMKMIHTRKTYIRAQKAEDEVRIILKIVIGDDGEDDDNGGGIGNRKEGQS